MGISDSVGLETQVDALKGAHIVEGEAPKRQAFEELLLIRFFRVCPPIVLLFLFVQFELTCDQRLAT